MYPCKSVHCRHLSESIRMFKYVLECLVHCCLSGNLNCYRACQYSRVKIFYGMSAATAGIWSWSRCRIIIRIRIIIDICINVNICIVINISVIVNISVIINVHVYIGINISVNIDIRIGISGRIRRKRSVRAFKYEITFFGFLSVLFICIVFNFVSVYWGKGFRYITYDNILK